MVGKNTDNLTQRGQRGGKTLLRWAGWYTLLFMAVAAAVFFPFFQAGKSFVWDPDGISQHYAELMYLRDTVREGVRALLHGEGWTFPLYDFSSGIASVNLQYGVLQLAVILWPGDLDSFYTVYTLASYYLTGLAFVYLGWYFRQGLLPVLTGSMTYAFCSFALFAGVRHPHFILPMAILPLLIVGVERVLCRERAWLLTAAVFLSVTSGFGVYFSCIQAALVCLYVCVRFFDYYHTRRGRELACLAGRLAIWGGTGALLGCATAVPTLVSIMSGDRVGKSFSMHWYDGKYYRRLLTRFAVADQGLGDWMYLGFSVLSLPALFLLFLRWDRKERAVRTLFLVLTLMHMIPAVGFVLSGFSNVSNRFCFGYALCVSVLLMLMLPRMKEIGRWQTAGVLALTGIYISISYMAGTNYKHYTPAVMVALALAAALACRYWRPLKRLFMPVCLVLTCISVFCTANARYAIRQYVDAFVDDPAAAIEAGQYASLAQSQAVTTDDGGFFRVAVDDVAARGDKNTAPHYGLNGVSGFPYYGQSMAYVHWGQELEMPWPWIVYYMSWPERYAAPAALANVKYYALRDGAEADMPYGFTAVDRVENGQNVDLIAENENWLPLGYTYEEYMTRQTYDALSALDKQQAQLQALVLDQAPRSADIREAETVPVTSRQVPVTVAAADGVIWDGERLEAEKDNATLTLSFEGLPETETYLRVVELDVTGSKAEEGFALQTATEETSAAGYWIGDNETYANRQHTQMLDLGWSAEGMRSVTITFPLAGQFTVGDIQVWCQDLSGLEEQTAALRAEALEDIVTDWHSLTGTVAVTRDKMLCLALPWLDGWKAYVDGEETELLHGNTAFMAVEVPEGEHEIRLVYHMPGLMAGLALSGAGLVCAAGLFLAGRKREKVHK